MARYEWPCPKCGQKQTATLTAADAPGKAHTLCAGCAEEKAGKEKGR